MVRRAAIGTYDSFNIVIAGVKGNLVEGIDLIYDTPYYGTPALDEVSSVYGLIAESACYPADFSWVSSRLREDARWHDGRRISPEDVIYSLQVFKKLHPQLAAYYRHVIHTEITGNRGVGFMFAVNPKDVSIKYDNSNQKWHATLNATSTELKAARE